MNMSKQDNSEQHHRVLSLILFHIESKDHPDYSGLVKDLMSEGLNLSEIHNYLRRVQDGDY